MNPDANINPGPPPQRRRPNGFSTRPTAICLYFSLDFGGNTPGNGPEHLEAVAQERDLAVLPLYGDLPAEQQDAALAPLERRKIVLATNVAETSVTVEGVVGVVDTGLAARTLSFDPGVGLDRLAADAYACASADPRTGRAGRTRPGVCVRLWSEASHRGRPERSKTGDTPCGPCGGRPASSLPGRNRRSALPLAGAAAGGESVAQALTLLRRLGAVDDQGVTELGRTLARLPAHPRLARLLVEGPRWGDPKRAALAAALLAERDPFTREMHDSTPFAAPRHSSVSDVLDRVETLEEWERTGRCASPFGTLNRGAARFILRARDQFLRPLRYELPRSDWSVNTRIAGRRGSCGRFWRPFPTAWRGRQAGSRREVMVGGGAAGARQRRDRAGAVPVHRRGCEPDGSAGASGLGGAAPNGCPRILYIAPWKSPSTPRPSGFRPDAVCTSRT